MGMKLLFIVITLLLIIGGMFFLISNPLTSLTETPLLVFCIMLLVCISFIITLDLQQKRLKTPLDQLPLAQKSDRKQRVFGLITFFIVIIITLIYFIIGKHAQSVPFVSETYFEKTRVNPTLSDEENGYEQLRALIGDIRHPLDEETLATYPFQVPTANGYRELGYGASLGREGNPSLTERLNAELQRIFNEGRPRPSREYYGTLAELLQAHPEVHPEAAIQTLEQSDFFTRLEKIVAMEWRDDDMFPTLQGIQGLERSLAYLAAYHADKGEFSTGIYYNTLALKLADKYLSNYSSLTQGLIATICLRTAMDATEYLLNHYELSPTDKAILLETYDTLLTTDIATAFQNIYKGEYHMIMNLSN
ncbi:MAG: hypothetical protein LBG59_06165 [Candidatus Peribacteria bacterium]|jgi:hypothetical protein|nr:hypothetical protein [Candidatus Peribacteria bacterium]